MQKGRQAYKSAKRSKELERLRRQEEKRRRRMSRDKTPGTGGGPPIEGEETTEPE